MLQTGSVQNEKKKNTHLKLCTVKNLIILNMLQKAVCLIHNSKVLHDNLPEEGVVLDTDLPEPFGSTMVWKLETDGAFKLLKLQQRKICEFKYIKRFHSS